MKNFKKQPRLTVFALSLISLITVFTSCVKDNSNNVTPPAKVMVVNAVSGSASQYLYINSSQVNSTAVAYGQTSGYLPTAAGSYNGQFKDAGSATVNTSFNINLQPAAYYTVYYTGNDTTKSSFVAQDIISSPSPTQAAVQFINFSTGVKSAINISVSGGGQLIANLPNGIASNYYSVAAGSAFALSAAASSTVLFTIPTLGLQNGSAYTIYITGSSPQTLSYHLVSHSTATNNL